MRLSSWGVGMGQKGVTPFQKQEADTFERKKKKKQAAVVILLQVYRSFSFSVLKDVSDIKSFQKNTQSRKTNKQKTSSSSQDTKCTSVATSV